MELDDRWSLVLPIISVELTGPLRLKPDEAFILIYLLDRLDEDDAGHCGTLHRGEDVEELDKESCTTVSE